MNETTRGLVFCGFSIIQKGKKKNKGKMNFSKMSDILPKGIIVI
ncbi:MAG: hypothetical protein WBW71_06580 [Bacteroidota bacterium]